jgi:molecular chaperone DnaK (HSP70)
MIKRAEDYADAAHQLRELADMRNYAEVLASEIELSLNEYYTRITESEELMIRGRIMSLRQVIEDVDIREIQTCIAALVEAAQVLRDED